MIGHVFDVSMTCMYFNYGNFMKSITANVFWFTCSWDNSMVLFNTIHSTLSFNGGVVRDPWYDQ